MALTPDERAQVEAIHHAHSRQAREVLNNSRMGADDRQIQLARNKVAAQRQLGVLRAQATQRAQATEGAARCRAFGLPPGADGSMVLAHRDARQHVMGATPGAAARLLEDALDSGDVTMATAVGQHAFGQVQADPLGAPHWGAIVEHFAASTPARQQAVSELAGQAADNGDRRAQIAESMLWHVTTPAEIRGMNADQLAARPLSTETD